MKKKPKPKPKIKIQNLCELKNFQVICVLNNHQRKLGGPFEEEEKKTGEIKENQSNARSRKQLMAMNGKITTHVKRKMH